MNHNERANSILRQRTLLIMDLKKKLSRLHDSNRLLQENNKSLIAKVEDLEAKISDLEKQKTFSQSKKYKAKKNDTSEPTSDS